MKALSKKSVINMLFILGMVLSWATYYLVSKWAVDYTGSVFLAGLFLRASAFVFLTIYIAIKKEFKLVFRVGKVGLILLLIGLLGYLLDLFANLGFSKGSVSTGTVLLKLDVLMANFVTVIILKKKLFLSDWISTFIMIVGVILVLDIDFSSMTFNWYDLFFILSAVAVTANAFTIKFTQSKFSINQDIIGYYNNLVVMVLFLVTALISGDISTINNIVAPYWFFLLILLGGLAQSLIYIFYYRNLRVYEVWKVKLYLLFIPIVSSIVGFVAFNDTFSLFKIIGIIVLLLGATGILLREKLNKKHISSGEMPQENTNQRDENSSIENNSNAGDDSQKP